MLKVHQTISPLSSLSPPPSPLSPSLSFMTERAWPASCSSMPVVCILSFAKAAAAATLCTTTTTTVTITATVVQSCFVGPSLSATSSMSLCSALPHCRCCCSLARSWPHVKARRREVSPSLSPLSFSLSAAFGKKEKKIDSINCTRTYTSGRERQTLTARPLFILHSSCVLQTVSFLAALISCHCGHTVQNSLRLL